jgi:hypothetical protein
LRVGGPVALTFDTPATNKVVIRGGVVSTYLQHTAGVVMKFLNGVRSRDRLLRDRGQLVRHRREYEEAGPIRLWQANKEGLLDAIDQRIEAIDKRMAVLERQ